MLVILLKKLFLKNWITWKKYDRMTQAINDHISLPNHEVDLLIKLLNQNQGKLSKNKREKHFKGLKITEI